MACLFCNGSIDKSIDNDEALHIMRSDNPIPEHFGHTPVRLRVGVSKLGEGQPHGFLDAEVNLDIEVPSVRISFGGECDGDIVEYEPPSITYNEEFSFSINYCPVCGDDLRKRMIADCGDNGEN